MTDATVLIIDSSSNILILSEPYSFLNTKIMPEDSPAGTNTDEAAKNAIVRIIKEKINFTIDKTRLTDINLVSQDEKKKYVFVYKINDEDKSTILGNRQIRFTFFPIVSLPRTLVPTSASIAVFITKEVNVLRQIPDPPGIIFTYPTIINYVPLYPVPVLIFVKEGIVPKISVLYENASAKLLERLAEVLPVKLNAVELIVRLAKSIIKSVLYCID